jgi:hypothetical protein
MRDLVARLRQQREEERKSGLSDLMAQLVAIGERLSEIDERIENLDVTSADAAQQAAAMILITSLYEHWRSNDEFGNTATLVALQPFLTGQIREHVDYVIEHPDHEMWGDAVLFGRVGPKALSFNEAAGPARRLLIGPAGSRRRAFRRLEIPQVRIP